MALMKSCKNIKKPTLIAAAAFDFIFNQEILHGEFSSPDVNVNVYGVPPNGSNLQYKALNSDKLDALEKFVRDKMEQSTDK